MRRPLATIQQPADIGDMGEHNTQAPLRKLHITVQRLLGAVREIRRGLLRDDVFMLAASIAYAKFTLAGSPGINREQSLQPGPFQQTPATASR